MYFLYGFVESLGAAFVAAYGNEEFHGIEENAEGMI